MIAALAAALFLAPKLVWIVLCTICAGAAAYEWARLIALQGAFCRVYVALVSVLTFSWPLLELPGTWSQAIYALAAVFWIFLVPSWLWRDSFPHAPSLRAGVGALIIFAATVALIELREAGPWVVLCVMGVVWISDTAAYFIGSAMGRRKLAARISPGKTWEGALGAMCFVMLYAFAWAFLSNGILPAVFTESSFGWLLLTLFMLVLAVLGIYGDLFESYMKRAAGVKDSGTLLPGHGGVLDRIDALLPVLPVAAWLFA